jgi:tetratricopeptide (TPR) repeat protein
LCPGCGNRQAESAFRYGVTLLVAAVLIGLVFRRSVFASGLLLFGSFCLSYLVSVAPHELGHAVAAWAVGLRLFTVTIGTRGRALFARPVLGYDLVLHAIPLGGNVFATPKGLRFVRLRNFLMVLAGPLCDGLLIVLAMGILRGISSERALYLACGGLFYASVLRLARNVFPWKFRRGGRLMANDGLQLLMTPFISRKSIAAWHSLTFYYEALEALQRDRVEDAERWLARGMEAYPDNSWWRLVQAGIDIHQRQYAEARNVYLAALGQPETPDFRLTPEYLAYLWDRVAWLDVMIADPALLDEADRYSRQALAQPPWLADVKGTRGSVLVELGRIDDGARLLEHALWESHAPAEKALYACQLAIAAARRGDPAAAQRYLDVARRRDPQCVLLERAVRELQRP